MNKKVLVLMVVLIASVVTVALASGIVSDDLVQIFNPSSEQKIDVSNAEAIAQTNIAKAKSFNDFSSIVNCGNEAKCNNVSSYISFMTSHTFTDKQLSVINEVLDNGTTIQSLIQVYDFWVTTDEPFSIIADICELEDKYLNLYWYEDAFNELTKETHGVMELSDIQEYNQKGVTNDVIMCANVLSRKKGQNIYNILDDVIDGQSLEEIACEIYKISELPKADTLYEKIMLVNTAKGMGIDTAQKDLNTTIQDVNSKFDIISDEQIQLATEKTQPEEYDEDELFEKIEQSNMHPKQIQILYNKGYTTKEIYLVSQMDDEDYFASAKKVRGGFGNE